MSDIYQRIWDADQASSGIKPVTDEVHGSREDGYVVVNDGPASRDLRVLAPVHIPEHKRGTYDLTRRLFDNYALAERDPEVQTPDERGEIHDLLTAVVETPPMLVAREYVQSRTGTVVTRERWYATLLEQWFRHFSMGGDPMLTGFEHVFVGEQQGGKVQGYHFWYKYWLNDGFADFDSNTFPSLDSDRIDYLRSRASSGQTSYPESVTISFKWRAPDYDRGGEVRPLSKPIGGFFVGCSLEGLMALGTVRAHLGARAPKEAVINGGRYAMKLFRSDNNAHVRTFYPKFLGPAGPLPPSPQPVRPVGPAPADSPPHPSSSPPAACLDIRIAGAVVNPTGHDPGRETVTLVNVGSSPVELTGWNIVDRNGKRSAIDSMLSPGEFKTWTLSGEPSQAQLSNKGGIIRLEDANGSLVHTVSYQKSQARAQGRTLIF